MSNIETQLSKFGFNPCSEKESNNDSVGNWNNEKGETIEMEDSPLTSTDLISLEKEAL